MIPEYPSCIHQITIHGGCFSPLILVPCPSLSLKKGDLQVIHTYFPGRYISGTWPSCCAQHNGGCPGGRSGSVLAPKGFGAGGFASPRCCLRRLRSDMVKRWRCLLKKETSLTSPS